ncbi:hypothetical protein ABPG72_001584 [Tetrahymena utriculariae]
MIDDFGKKKNSDFANDLQSFGNNFSEEFFQMNPFQRISLTSLLPNSVKPAKKQPQKVSNQSQLSLKAFKNICWQSQCQKNTRPLTTLLNIKKQTKQNKKTSATFFNAKNQKGNFKIHEMFKLDDFLNSKKSHQITKSDVNGLLNNHLIENEQEILSIPSTDFIKYTLTDKCGSLSSRTNASYSSKAHISPKMNFTSCCNNEILRNASQKSTQNKINEQSKQIAPEQFIQTQRKLTNKHKAQYSSIVNPDQNLVEQAENNALKQSQFKVNHKSNITNNIQYNKNSTKIQDHIKSKQISNPSLIRDLLNQEKNKDSQLTKNYNQSVKVQSEIENRKQSTHNIGIELEKKEEELKQKFMKKIFEPDGALNGGGPSKEKQQKLSITNPIFTEVDKSSLADRSQTFILSQIQMKQQQKTLKKKPRIWSAQPQLNDTKNKQESKITSASFFGIIKNQSPNINQSKTYLREEEDILIQQNQLTDPKIQEGKEVNVKNIYNSSNPYYNQTYIKQHLKSSQQTSTNYFKQMIHPELQSFTSIQRKPTKEAINLIINTPNNQNNTKTPSKKVSLNSNTKIQLLVNNKKALSSNKSEEILLQRSKTFDEEKYQKEIESNLTIYKYSSNNYRPQTARLQSQHKFQKKKEDNQQRKSFDSLKSWENLDIEDNSGIL